MTLVIWGAGAIGGTIGAYLIRAGHDVLLVDKDSDHVEAINRDGLKITGPVDTFTVNARALLPAAVDGSYQTIILATKAHHTQAAAELLKPHLAQDGLVVSAQNGLNELVIQEIVGQERTMGAFVNFGADYHGPGEIFFGGRGAVVLGEIDGAMTERLQALHTIMTDFEPNAIMTPNIWGYLWGKQAYSALLNLTALTPESIADSLANPDHYAVYVTAAREICVTAKRLGIQPLGFNGFEPEAFMPDADPGLTQASMQAMVAFNRGSGKTHSGVWRDIAVRKRQTEVSKFDVVIAEAERVGTSLPFTERWTAMMREIDQGKRQQSVANLDELKESLPTH